MNAAFELGGSLLAGLGSYLREAGCSPIISPSSAAASSANICRRLVLAADRGDLMERVRKNYLSAELEISPEERALILYVTHLFERAAWSLGQYGRLRRRGSREDS
jgi:hypothetical protein